MGSTRCEPWEAHNSPAMRPVAPGASAILTELPEPGVANSHNRDPASTMKSSPAAPAIRNVSLAPSFWIVTAALPLTCSRPSVWSGTSVTVAAGVIAPSKISASSEAGVLRAGVQLEGVLHEPLGAFQV